jgi:hypothetical protein
MQLKWLNNGTYTQFNFSSSNAPASNNYYIAFAFSNDQQMGDDGVCSCVLLGSSSGGAVWQMYNPGHVTPGLLDSGNPSVGLINMAVASSNGVFTCSFMRANQNSTLANYFPLNKLYYLLLAKGYVSGRNSISKIVK